MIFDNLWWLAKNLKNNRKQYSNVIDRYSAEQKLGISNFKFILLPMVLNKPFFF